jgi:hypothetical protein
MLRRNRGRVNAGIEKARNPSLLGYLGILSLRPERLCAAPLNILRPFAPCFASTDNGQPGIPSEPHDDVKPAFDGGMAYS